MELGRVSEAESALTAFERAAQLAGDAEAMVMVTARHAMLATLRGRFGDALRLAGQVPQAGNRIGLADTPALGPATPMTRVAEQWARDRGFRHPMVHLSYRDGGHTSGGIPGTPVIMEA